MKYCLILAFFIFCGIKCISQSVDSKQVHEKPVTVINKSVVSEKISQSKAQLATDEQNANAWLNTYLWTEKDKTLSAAARDQLLEKTITEAGMKINGSWQYNLMKFIASGRKDHNALRNALKGDKLTVLPYAIQHAIIYENSVDLDLYTGELNKMKPMSQATFNYHLNTLKSAPPNAVIYAKGINDLVPLAILQYQHHIRKDITLRFYEGTITDPAKAYLCISSGREILENFPGSTYSGLLVKVSPADIQEEYDVMDSLDLSILKQSASFSKEEIQMYRNYLPFLIMHYKKIRINEPEKAALIKQYVIEIAQPAGIYENVIKLLEK